MDASHGGSLLQVGADEEKDVDENGHEHVLTNLRKFAEYSVRVVAYNSNGPGLSTAEVVQRTLSDVPSEPPQNVTLETASSTVRAACLLRVL